MIIRKLRNVLFFNIKQRIEILYQMSLSKYISKRKAKVVAKRQAND